MILVLAALILVGIAPVDSWRRDHADILGAGLVLAAVVTQSAIAMWEQWKSGSAGRTTGLVFVFTIWAGIFGAALVAVAIWNPDFTN